MAFFIKSPGRRPCPCHAAPGTSSPLQAHWTEVLQGEAKAPRLTKYVVKNFGDEGVRYFGKHVPTGDLTRLVGYAEKAKRRGHSIRPQITRMVVCGIAGRGKTDPEKANPAEFS